MHASHRVQGSKAAATPSVAYVTGAASTTAATTASSLDITIPATAVAGNVAILTFNIGGNIAVGTIPSGWTLRVGRDNNSVNNEDFAIYTKTLVSGDINTALTWHTASAVKINLLVDVYSGATETNFTYSAVSFGNTSVLSFPNPTITVPANGAIHGIWGGFINSATSPTVTPPGTYSGGQATKTSFASSNIGIASAYKLGSGSLGGDNCSFSAATARQGSYSVAVSP